VLSPGGDTLALIVNEGEHQVLEVLATQTGERRPLFSTAGLGDNAALAGVDWADAETLLFSVFELTDGVADLSDTRRRVRLHVVRIDGDRPVLRFIQTPGVVVDSLPQTPHELLYAVPGMNTSIVYRIDTRELQPWGVPLAKTAAVDGGQFSRQRRVTEIEGLALRWITDASGELRAVLHMSPDAGAIKLSTRIGESEDWRSEREWKLSSPARERARRRQHEPAEAPDIPRPLALVEGTSDFVIIGTDEGRNALFRYNYQTESRTLLYRHPHADIAGARFGYDGTDLLSVSYFENGLLRHDYLETAFRDVAERFETAHLDSSAFVTGRDVEGDRYLVYLTSATQPGRVFSYDAKSDAMNELFAVAPWLDAVDLARSTAGHFERDGLTIEYYLTLPNAAYPTSEPIRSPLVLYPHGGPFGVRDYRSFDPVVQYLAHRGFAVLQVNFRGSGGFGSAFQTAGEGQFGAAILEDLEAALAQVSDHPSLDARRICIVGDSYGGYAALMLAIRQPDAYACVASFAGVTDVALLLGSYSDAGRRVLLPLITDIREGNGHYQTLTAISPVWRADALTVPVRLTHGKLDRRVDIEHAYRMKMRLEQLGKPFEWRVYADVGHGFTDARLAYEHARELADFLTEHIGTR
jgi:acetyl esterase/lipase